MTAALIGQSGVVGTTLLRQRPFDCGYRSTTIGDIDGREFDLAVCCAAPAQKWLANREPDGDRRGIQGLIEAVVHACSHHDYSKGRSDSARPTQTAQGRYRRPSYPAASKSSSPPLDTCRARSA